MVALTPEGWLRRWRRPGPSMLTCTRALLDWVVREAVLERAPVRIRKAAVVGLTGSAGQVHGVRLAEPGGDTDLDADLVVDASGRGTRVVSWLDGIGVTGVREQAVDSGLVNASRLYRVPEGAEDFPLTIVQPNPYLGRAGRSAMIMPVEGGRWLVSCGGTRGGEPPADPEGFLRYTLALPDPIVGRLISGAEPLGDVHLSRSTSNVRRYLEKLPGVAGADSWCSATRWPRPIPPARTGWSPRSRRGCEPGADPGRHDGAGAGTAGGAGRGAGGGAGLVHGGRPGPAVPGRARRRAAVPGGTGWCRRTAAA
ncbi:hypothetical protein SALBM217S_01680 [Streptomyces griseoloalbus]